MSNEPRLDFPMLDSTGSDYHSWVTDVENHLTSKGILPIIQAPNPDLLFNRTSTKHAQAVILMRRHMDKALRLEYMSIKDARELWVALEERFGNVQDSLLPDLKVQWNNLLFADFKSVAEYNSEALRLQSMLRFCGQPVTEQELIEKTLSTFPVSAIVVSKQYRTEVNAGRITRFHQLINIISVAEKHDNILVRNYNSRPIGTKSVHEANYNAPKRGRKERNSRNKGHEGRMGPYNRPNQEGNRKFGADTRGGNATRGRGGRGNPIRGNGAIARGGGAMGRGGGANPPRERPQRAPQLKGGNHNDMCHRCGSSEHWFKQCKASEQLASRYRAYRDLREQEVYLAEEEENGGDVNLTMEDFKAEDEVHKDAADFD
ncbi:putative transcription factor interactor and regulator CCHC(Zn) family [Rosa chinensis]|uniref:Putative transcription factor interactor and regulator CCHC(Zn) family n=1 Tax=Rosa chinensis TaxID=74649 RepID=A0A2P6RMV7_ROSCH|nr:putative transcription factor interactor and regulator CCHC(Zn) family [Rosa chinensis]